MRWLVPTLFALAACSEQEFNVENIAPPTGDLKITGRVCHPLLRTWIPDALVYTHLYDNIITGIERRNFLCHLLCFELLNYVTHLDYSANT